MNTTTKYRDVILHRTLIATAVASILLTAACTTAPVKPDGAAEARTKLTQLQSDPNLASRAAVAIKEADVAVRAAEQPEADKELAAHRVYLADRKVDTAKALAQTRFAEDQRAELTAQRDSARLDARTHEADAAKGQAATARAEGAEQKAAADQARLDANTAQLAAASSEQQSAELQRQIDVLHAKPTDRGLVLTLGDVLFTTGRADLKPGATGNLNKLVTFLDKYPDRNVAIQGYTDSVGSGDSNQRLSERRADAVKSYLTGQGVSPMRLSAAGKGQSDPVADNDSAAGRQQNRRVEVIISNPPAASR
jgi:outer membrane protein OmpA-like peptidoglycan-associated protein